MSRQYDAKQEVLKAYPDDRQSGVDMFLGYLGVSEGDFRYEEGMSPEEYIYGNATAPTFPGITKEWFERRAKAEADLEIGAGFSVVNMTDEDIARMEVVAERSLPQWAQDELSRLRAIALDLQKQYIIAADALGKISAETTIGEPFKSERRIMSRDQMIEIARAATARSSNPNSGE